jgi:hypothetical protein
VAPAKLFEYFCTVFEKLLEPTTFLQSTNIGSLSDGGNCLVVVDGSVSSDSSLEVVSERVVVNVIGVIGVVLGGVATVLGVGVGGLFTVLVVVLGVIGVVVVTAGVSVVVVAGDVVNVGSLVVVVEESEK